MSRLTMLVSGLWPTQDENGFMGYPGMVFDNADIIAHYSNDLTEVLTGLSFDELDLIGHSLGAMTCLDFAQTSLKPVRRLILIDPVRSSWPFNPFAWFMGLKSPSNVEQALCINKAFGLPPAVSFSNTSDKVKNVKVSSWDHANLPRLDDVKKLIREALK